MPLIARASNTVRNKNLAILLMCAGMTIWFAYDGWNRYPAMDNACVGALVNSPLVESGDKKVVQAWKGWENETPEIRATMDSIVSKYSGKPVLGEDDSEKREWAAHIKNWKSTGDIGMQRWIVYVLVFFNGLAIWWFVHCQRRRAVADDATLSPAPGVVIPWEKITRIDNTRWRNVGIVELTYTDTNGKTAKARLDDYETQRTPLLEILDLLSAKAVNAEVVPKEDPQEKPAQDASGAAEEASK